MLPVTTYIYVHIDQRALLIAFTAKSDTFTSIHVATVGGDFVICSGLDYYTARQKLFHVRRS